jgi:hypothetical protein
MVTTTTKIEIHNDFVFFLVLLMNLKSKKVLELVKFFIKIFQENKNKKKFSHS